VAYAALCAAAARVKLPVVLSRAECAAFCTRCAFRLSRLFDHHLCLRAAAAEGPGCSAGCGQCPHAVAHSCKSKKDRYVPLPQSTCSCCALIGAPIVHRSGCFPRPPATAGHSLQHDGGQSRAAVYRVLSGAQCIVRYQQARPCAHLAPQLRYASAGSELQSAVIQDHLAIAVPHTAIYTHLTHEVRAQSPSHLTS